MIKCCSGPRSVDVHLCKIVGNVIGDCLVYSNWQGRDIIITDRVK